MADSSTATGDLPPIPGSGETERAAVKSRALDRLLDDTNIDLKVWDEVFEIIWGARPSDSEIRREGYRLGFEAGKAVALYELSDSVAVPQAKRAPAPHRTPKCSCGHAISTHNELGYCQARRDKSDPKHSTQCYCDSFSEAKPAERG